MRNDSQRLLAGGLIAGLFGVSVTLWSASGAEQAAIPNFSPDSRTGWIAGDPNGENPVGQDFLPPESGPSPVTSGALHCVDAHWRKSLKLGVRINSVAPTRSNLIKKGMIYSPSHGDTALTVPLFHEYMKRAMATLD